MNNILPKPGSLLEVTSIEDYKTQLESDAAFNKSGTNFRHFDWNMTDAIEYFTCREYTKGKKFGNYLKKYVLFSEYLNSYIQDNDLNSEESRQVWDSFVNTFEAAKSKINTHPEVLDCIRNLAMSIEYRGFVNYISKSNLKRKEIDLVLENYHDGSFLNFKNYMVLNPLQAGCYHGSSDVRASSIVSFYKKLFEGNLKPYLENNIDTVEFALVNYSKTEFSEYKKNDPAHMYFLPMLMVYAQYKPNSSYMSSLESRRDECLEALYGKKGKSVYLTADALGEGFDIEYWKNSKLSDTGIKIADASIDFTIN